MSLFITCPQCQRKLKIADAATGKNVKCPGCASVFKASTPSIAPAPPSPQPAGAEVEPSPQEVLEVQPAEPRRQTAPKKKQSNALLYGGLVGVFVVLLCGGAVSLGVYWLYAKGKQTWEAAELPSTSRREAKDAPEMDASFVEAKIKEAGAGVKLVKLDLDRAGLPLTMEAPEGATAEVGNGEVVVRRGENFALRIAIGRHDLAGKKKFALGRRTIAFPPDLLLLEEGGFGAKPHCTFAVNVATGYRDYAIETEQGPLGKESHYSQADCWLMIKCARTLAPNAPLPDDPVAILKWLKVTMKADENGKITYLDGGARMSDSTMPLLRKLPDLQTLGLDHCSIQDDTLAHLSGCIHLKQLVLSGTNVTDDGLRHLSGLTTLEELYLGNAWLSLKISGAGLAHLAGLRQLHTLYLDRTEVDDQGLAQLSELRNLKSLTLSWTRVTGTGLARLKGLTKLKHLNLSNTKVTDAGVAALETLTNLEEFNLDDTEITGDGLTCLKDLKKLKYLSLNGAKKLTDKGVAEIGKATSLEDLELRQTPLGDDGLSHLKGLKRLNTLDLRYTKVSGKGAQELKKALPKARIEYGSD